jgi:type VI secretion system protein VasD
MFVIHSKRRVLACAVVLSVCLTGCGLSQKVIEGSKSMAAALFYKQINILHLDFIPVARSTRTRKTRRFPPWCISGS